MTIKFTVRIKPQHNPPDLGGGEGIIATQEVEYKGIDAEAFKTDPQPFAIVSILDHADELLKEWVEASWEVVDEKPV